MRIFYIILEYSRSSLLTGKLIIVFLFHPGFPSWCPSDKPSLAGQGKAVWNFAFLACDDD